MIVPWYALLPTSYFKFYNPVLAAARQYKIQHYVINHVSCPPSACLPACAVSSTQAHHLPQAVYKVPFIRPFAALVTRHCENGEPMWMPIKCRSRKKTQALKSISRTSKRAERNGQRMLLKLRR